MQKEDDQTFYFVLADCRGALEIVQDEFTKRDHLLGLNALWQDINEQDYKNLENTDQGDLQYKRQNFMKQGY